MLKAWAEYEALKDKPASQTAELISLSELSTAAAAPLMILPAYAQAQYVYQNHVITALEPQAYERSDPLHRVNQFDQMGPAYNIALQDILSEKRLGRITVEAGKLLASEANIMLADGHLVSGRLMVIDSLRTVDAAYLLAAANPQAVANKLLSTPGASAHNKGMAIDLTLVYQNNTGEWLDADMLGHIDHPDMQTNHRNYTDVSPIQRHNRLYLEQLMLRGAFGCGMLLAPLREEFWDFRFAEDGLDLWRVLEAISRAAGIADAHRICAEKIESIRNLCRAGNAAAAYAELLLDQPGFANQCLTLFNSDEARYKLARTLHITPEEIAGMQPVFHGDVRLIFDAMLPAHQAQANPSLRRLFE